MLQWDFREKVGAMTVQEKTEDTGAEKWIEREIDLYNGNAYLIMIYEYTEAGKDMYSLFSFFCDKKHMRRVLGLEKGTRNLLQDDYTQVKKIRINKAKCRNYADILAGFAAAFDNIQIDVYTE